ncbi:hypothetical protein CDCA_CDCA13G3565 [Cyanidium caldarium]|uniref:Carbonic anhydrase n=1 Tax=Cyanidium caldarium TaxID=2771 RepID=A0AAV9IZQ0_CYACA|nr:hypothetical protein CDCA_CDCA13G3565 [Cyanidium caldarium]
MLRGTFVAPVGVRARWWSGRSSEFTAPAAASSRFSCPVSQLVRQLASIPGTVNRCARVSRRLWRGVRPKNGETKRTIVSMGGASGKASRSVERAEQSWRQLLEGNRRFVGAAAGGQTPITAEREEAVWNACAPAWKRGTSLTRRQETSIGQSPQALVICCSDSRVVPEFAFNCGIGDLFSVECAGNVVDRAAAASISFYLRTFDIPLVVVLGHSSCAAVSGACDMFGGGAGGNRAASPTNLYLRRPEETDFLTELLQNIQPAVNLARASHPQLEGAALVEQTITQNVRNTKHELLRHLRNDRHPEFVVKMGKYDIATGLVEEIADATESAAAAVGHGVQSMPRS